MSGRVESNEASRMPGVEIVGGRGERDSEIVQL